MAMRAGLHEPGPAPDAKARRDRIRYHGLQQLREGKKSDETGTRKRFDQTVEVQRVFPIRAVVTKLRLLAAMAAAVSSGAGDCGPCASRIHG